MFNNLLTRVGLEQPSYVAPAAAAIEEIKKRDTVKP